MKNLLRGWTEMKKYEEIHNNIHNCTSLISYVIVVHCARQINFFVSEWVRRVARLNDIKKNCIKWNFADAVDEGLMNFFYFLCFSYSGEELEVKRGEDVYAVWLFHLWVSRMVDGLGLEALSWIWVDSVKLVGMVLWIYGWNLEF